MAFCITSWLLAYLLELIPESLKHTGNTVKRVTVDGEWTFSHSEQLLVCPLQTPCRDNSVLQSVWWEPLQADGILYQRETVTLTADTGALRHRAQNSKTIKITPERLKSSNVLRMYENMKSLFQSMAIIFHHLMLSRFWECMLMTTSLLAFTRRTLFQRPILRFSFTSAKDFRHGNRSLLRIRYLIRVQVYDYRQHYL